MESPKTSSPKKRTIIAKIANVLSYILVFLVLLVIIVVLLLQTAPVQNFVRGKLQTFLQNKLKTRVEIGKLDLSFPDYLLLKNVYIEDQTKDTLIYGGELKVDMHMWKLLQGDIQVKEINLDNITLKVKRLLPDTVFNFQFITNAFSGPPTTTKKPPDTNTIVMNIDNIVVNNTRIVYKDVITGNDMDMSVKHFDVPIKTFDINHLYFNIPKFTLRGVRGHFYQNEPLQAKIVSAVAQATQAPENTLQLKNDEIALSDIDLDYRSGPSSLGMGLKINSMMAHPALLDLKNGKYSFKDFTLDKSDISITMSNKAAPPPTAQQKQDEASLPALTFSSDAIKITGSNFKMNNTSMPVLNYGMDYGHLDIKDLNLAIEKAFYNVDTLAANIKSGSMTEKSGLVLNEFNTNLLYTTTGISLQDLYLKTPGTLLRNKAIISYPSLEQLSASPGLLGLDINLDNSTVLVKDMLLFAPQLHAQPAFSNASQTWKMNGRVYGHMNDLHFTNFSFKGFGNTNVAINGTLKGLPDPKKFQADLSIPYFNTTKTDIIGLLPKNTLPANIELPATISASGKLATSMNDLVTDLTIKTSSGSAKLTGSVNNFADPKKAKYDMAATIYALNLGAIMKDPKTYGTLSGNFKAVGSGFDPITANAKINGVISSVGYNQYTYKNIRLDASIANKKFTANAIVKDPNIDLSFVASGNMNGKYPSLQLTADIDSIKTQPLHFTPQPLTYHGKIKGDFSSLDPDNLAGNLLVTQSILLNNGQRFSFDSLALTAENSGDTHSLILKSDFITAGLKGRYKLTQMGDVFQQAINPYFTISTQKNGVKVDPYNFSLTGGITQNAALKAFMPGLNLKPVNLTAHFASDSGWNAFMSAPLIVYGTNTINDLKFNAATKNGELTFNTSISKFLAGSSLAVFATTLDGSLQSNNLNFTLNIKDSKSVNKYTLSGLLSQPSPNSYSFSLKPDNLLLNYNKWSANAGNSIQYFNSDITATNFILNQGNQQLSVNSVGTGTNKPLSISFKDFSISTLTAFAQTDSLLVNGTLNGNAVVKNIQVQPVFTTDITVNNLSVYKDTVGNLTAKINNNVANTYNADIALTGNGNEVKLGGNYFVKPENSSYDFTLNIVSLQMKSLEGFTKGGIRESRGNIVGSIALNGSLDEPNIDGKISFNNIAFVVSSLNNLFRIDKEDIAVINNEGIRLNNFSIHDTANNAITIDGAVNTPDFIDYSFDLKVKADNFQAVNSTKKDNNLFYGKMVFSTSLTITGTPTQPKVDGSLTINDKTDFTAVLPQSDPSVVQSDGIVRFVNYSDSLSDSLFMRPYDSLKKSPLQGYDISININVSKEAVFNLIVDEGNGDFLRLKGTAQLNAGIDESGKITLTGSYEIEEGSYDLSFNFIKRKFLIQKGSKITWTGEPTSANIDVTAIYIANTAPADLMQDPDNNLYKQKLPFEVHLVIGGEILKPDISFDVVLPTEGNYNVSTDIIGDVETRLAQLRQETAELNKQVFALLLLNRFVGENPFDNSSGGSGGASSFARESVSKLLTEQLNQLAAGLISGVDLNFDLASTQDYSTGTQQQRTDFNVGLSKRLLNDRLTVTLGTDFELEGPKTTNQGQNNAAANIAVDYKLSKDGRYMLRAYRKNDYTGDIEGYVIETGVGFIISVDYNRFRQIFQSRKGPKTPKKKAAKSTTPPASDDKQQNTNPPKEI